MRNRKGNKNYHNRPVEGVYERSRGQLSIHANIQTTGYWSLQKYVAIIDHLKDPSSKLETHLKHRVKRNSWAIFGQFQDC